MNNTSIARITAVGARLPNMSAFIPLVGLVFATHVSAQDRLPGDLDGPTQATSVIATNDGPVSGLDNGSIVAFLGLPFAAPPVGGLRWVPPKSPDKWNDVRQANRLAAACLQNADLGVFASAGGSEDCLYLNVYADRQAFNRARSSDKKLPVFVWIHGGALQVGQGADYDPRGLATEGKAIVVTINYRLGIFGFLAHPAIDSEGHAVANYGQMDQTKAIRWVHENIASFGGDQKNITIAGESSGGTSVITQILSPWAAGLFQNAIEMSGGSPMIREPHFAGVTTLKTAEKVGEAFAEAHGCDDPATAAACLRALTPGEVLSTPGHFYLAQTVMDGDFLPSWPSELLKAGKFNRVNIVSGNVQDEGDFFAALPELASGNPMTAEAYPSTVRNFYGNVAEAVLKEYPLADYLTPSEAYSKSVTDYLFACPAFRFRELASQHTSVWSYEFADRTAPSYTAATSFDLRATHTFELPFLFPGFHGGSYGIPTVLNPLQDKLATQMQAYWTDVSSAANWSNWPGFNRQDNPALQFNLAGSKVISGEEYSREHRCEFWNAQGVF